MQSQSRLKYLNYVYYCKYLKSSASRVHRCICVNPQEKNIHIFVGYYNLFSSNPAYWPVKQYSIFLFDQYIEQKKINKYIRFLFASFRVFLAYGKCLFKDFSGHIITHISFMCYKILAPIVVLYPYTHHPFSRDSPVSVYFLLH